MIALWKDQPFPATTVPKPARDNFDDFDLAHQFDARRQVGLYGILLDYLYVLMMQATMMHCVI